MKYLFSLVLYLSLNLSQLSSSSSPAHSHPEAHDENEKSNSNGLEAHIADQTETVTQSYDPDRLKNQKLYLQLFHNVPKIEPPPPDTKAGGGTSSCDRCTFFYSFNPACQKAVARIVQKLQTAPNPTALIKRAAKIRDLPGTHPKAWFAALTIVTLDRSDMRGLWKPHPLQVMPDTFLRNFDPMKWAPKADGSQPSGQNCVRNDETFAADNGIENRLWYYREDIQVNAQHWYWHITFPHYLYPSAGNATVYHANRRGELFYYYHHHMIARYNAERLSNGLSFVAPLVLDHGTILDPYYVHLNDANSGREWADRLPLTPIPEVIRFRVGSTSAGASFFLQSCLQSRDRLNEGIDVGYLEGTEGQHIPIENARGIDILVDSIEPSNFSANPAYYGSLHNGVHLLIALASDPTSTNSPPGPMADTAVSMRDISFYNWHGNLDVMCDRHKRTLPPYQVDKGEFPLLWRSVRVEQISMTSAKGQANKLQTFWSMKNVTLDDGLAFQDPNNNLTPVNVCIKHLNHDDFTYHLAITAIPNGVPPGQIRATIRIFLAPRFGSDGKRFTMAEQRLLFFALDAFATNLQPGLNTIRRPSSRSTLTTRWDQTIETLQPSTTTVIKNKPYCGCGWPDHLLMPKGTKAGMVFDLFVMVTNGKEDLVKQNENNSNYTSECRSAYILCSLPHLKYPDARPMGYPFDRTPFRVSSFSLLGGTEDREVVNLDEYVKNLQNTGTTQIVIQHVDRVMERNKA